MLKRPGSVSLADRKAFRSKIRVGPFSTRISSFAILMLSGSNRCRVAQARSFNARTFGFVRCISARNSRTETFLMSRPPMRRRMCFKFKVTRASIAVISTRSASSRVLFRWNSRITIGPRNGASILSIVATKPSWRANHQTHRRTPLEIAIGASAIANVTMSSTKRLARKNRFLRGITASWKMTNDKSRITNQWRSSDDPKVSRHSTLFRFRHLIRVHSTFVPVIHFGFFSGEPLNTKRSGCAV